MSCCPACRAKVLEEALVYFLPSKKDIFKASVLLLLSTLGILLAHKNLKKIETPVENLSKNSNTPDDDIQLQKKAALEGLFILCGLALGFSLSWFACKATVYMMYLRLNQIEKIVSK